MRSNWNEIATGKHRTIAGREWKNGRMEKWNLVELLVANQAWLVVTIVLVDTLLASWSTILFGFLLALRCSIRDSTPMNL